MAHKSTINLPQGDHTPDDYQLPFTDWREIIKRPVRRLVYPVMNVMKHRALAKRYATSEFQPDLWLWGQRGNDYERLRRRLNRFYSLHNSDILIAGCGTGRDVESWLKFKPRTILGLDWFSYQRAWKMWEKRFTHIASDMDVSFQQADLTNLQNIPDASLDIVASDAVFEHLNNLPAVLAEFYRVLRPGGLLYATFGPLWYCWGGDHISGFDNVISGYNHLNLDQAAYQTYLAGMGEHSHSEHDGRTWLKHDLFSRLAPEQYLGYLDEVGFKRQFVAAIIQPKAVECLQHPQFNTESLHQYKIIDLLIDGMTIIYER